jgi:hypothetical protein
MEEEEPAEEGEEELEGAPEEGEGPHPQPVPAVAAGAEAEVVALAREPQELQVRLRAELVEQRVQLPHHHAFGGTWNHRSRVLEASHPLGDR